MKPQALLDMMEMPIPVSATVRSIVSKLEKLDVALGQLSLKELKTEIKNSLHDIHQNLLANLCEARQKIIGEILNSAELQEVKACFGNLKFFKRTWTKSALISAFFLILGTVGSFLLASYYPQLQTKLNSFITQGG